MYALTGLISGTVLDLDGLYRVGGDIGLHGWGEWDLCGVQIRTIVNESLGPAALCIPPTTYHDPLYHNVQRRCICLHTAKNNISCSKTITWLRNFNPEKYFSLNVLFNFNWFFLQTNFVLFFMFIGFRTIVITYPNALYNPLHYKEPVK